YYALDESKYGNVPFVRLTPMSGAVLPEDEQSLEVTLDAKDLAPGTHTAEILIHASGGDLHIPVHVTVLNLLPASLVVQPDSVSERLYVGTTSQIPITLRNDG